jgi:hypothetical protein
MSEDSYKYKGQTITVYAHQKTAEPETWEPGISISGVRHILTVLGGYPPKIMPTEAAALEYGRKAAEWIIDNPIKTDEKLKP